MDLYLYSHNHFVIQHWQEALSNYRLTIENNYDRLLEQLHQQPLDSVLLYDFSPTTIQLEKDLKQLPSGYPCIVLDCQANFQRGKIALNVGALGYGNALMHKVHLHSAIATALEGKVWLYPDFISELIMQVNQTSNSSVEENPHLDKLSEREREVAILVKQGLNNKEIAERLDITVRTVKAHTGKIYEKLGVKDRLGLVVLL